MLTLKSTLNALANNTGKIFLGFSGGLDSTVLIDLFAKEATDDLIARTTVLHIDHGLSPNAKQWSEHCNNQASARKLPIEIIKINAKAHSGESPEAAAREARYSAFINRMQPNDFLLLAHHHNDQVETFFLQLFRGAGVKGLSGMSLEKRIKNINIIRPLLNYSRRQLEDYAIANDLHWIDDESNFDTSFYRNFIRHELLPLIQQKWSNVNTVISRTQKLCQESDQLLTELAEVDYQQCKTDQSSIISLNKIKKLNPLRRANLLRYWITLNQFPLPSQIKINEIENSLLSAKPDASPIILWKQTELRRYRDNIYILKPIKRETYSDILILDINNKLILPDDLGTIDKSIYAKYDIPFPNSNTKTTIRFRQGGEFLELPNRKGHHALKKLFQEWGIPPWERDRIPLLYHDDKLVAVIYYKMEESSD